VHPQTKLHNIVQPVADFCDLVFSNITIGGSVDFADHSLIQGWQVFAAGWKNGKNSLLPTKTGFCH